MLSQNLLLSSSTVIMSAAVIGLGTAPAANAADKSTVYVGTYTGAKSKGVYRFEFDSATGKAGEPSLAVATPSPAFLAIHPTRNVLYAVNEVNEVNGEKGGGLSAYEIAKNGNLTPINQVSTVGGGPCHLAVDANGKAVLVANYGGGSVISYQLESSGKIGKRATFIQHEGSSANAQRQEAAHAHGAYLDAKNRFAYVPDLGMDKVVIYKFDAEKGTLAANTPAAGILEPGSGPRHFALHPTLPYAWSINELLCSVSTFRVDPKNGGLERLSSVTTLPQTQREGDSTAELFLHPNGKFLYGSNRGHDSVTVFAIDPASGTPNMVQNQPIGGKTPRNFAIDPTGHWLLAAAQGSDVINVFQIDEKTGKLSPTDTQVKVPTPVCVVFRGK